MRLISKVFLFLLGLLSIPAWGQPLRVDRLSLSLNAGFTRLVLEADRPITAEISSQINSLGLNLRLLDGQFALSQSLTGEASGVVTGLRPALGQPDTISLQLLDGAMIDRAFQLPPQGGRGHRLVIDLLPADPAAFLEAFAAPVKLPLAAPLQPAATPPGRDPRRLIVLDPGHGGHDPGAISASGRYEKELTLAVGRAIAARLRASGRYRVLLTRDKDVAVKLLDRVKLARNREADLFLSIHADSLAADRATRGASVYTRAEDASDRDAEALALRENKADQLADTAREQELDDVLAILVDLASRDTKRLSGRFAGLLTASLSERIPLRRNALRAANFKVLGAPDIPSALLELGYISNPTEEALLFSEAGRNQLAEAVVAAIDRFFDGP
ncbi:N-acetylmuramoyl-L-alanine amidase [Ferrovibrio sp.]|uniref:N-acetylmuramoyl-L-alanine amidase family protein n=1 Tax=Ferrovibrio sp. TaxID=1917215 RepID=UPI0025C495CA|nr:N-acetylmuramoyl-L-alanine amidase [Ferrovibrio sp.]MBX3454712.1 N-acetylmuramoyl-L-alanine amidase [Ferrovibrio sp.]